MKNMFGGKETVPERKEGVTPSGFISFIESNQDIPILNEEERKQLHEQMSQEDIITTYIHLTDLPREKREHIAESWIPRPKELYHASVLKDVDHFEPRAGKKRHPSDPPQIFATPSEAVASMFLVPINDTFVISGSYDNGRTWTMVVGNERRYRELDKGGYVYKLPPQTFSVDTEQGLGLFEWTSTQPVKPESSVFYPSALQAALEKGVKVYFVDHETFNRFSEEDHIELLSHLQPF